MPIYSFDDSFGDSTPFYVFGAKTGDEEEVEDDEEEWDPDMSGSTFAPRLQITDFDDCALELDDEPLTTPPRSPSCIGEAYLPGSPLGLLEPLSPSLLSPTCSLRSVDPVVMGEAAAVDVRSVGRRPSRIWCARWPAPTPPRRSRPRCCCRRSTSSCP